MEETGIFRNTLHKRKESRYNTKCFKQEGETLGRWAEERGVEGGKEESEEEGDGERQTHRDLWVICALTDSSLLFSSTQTTNG